MDGFGLHIYCPEKVLREAGGAIVTLSVPAVAAGVVAHYWRCCGASGAVLDPFVSCTG